MVHAEPEDHQDAMFVWLCSFCFAFIPGTKVLRLKYVLLVDTHATTFYGRLLNIFIVWFPPALELKLKEEETLILAAIQNYPITARNDLDMHYY
jgi:hypothetical protein